ncbi:ribosomal protein S18-alanine N-acetyltransferase [Betaproteobacteria bacterium]|nr:ribosomal protein S18-alanine N-acetyltransferase [Betaproteobacteria bacterium]
MVGTNDKKNVFDTLPWLSIESVGKSASLAIVFQKNNRLQIITEQVESREGDKDSILPLVEKAAESSVGSIQRINKCVLINGPGSFTGLRVVNSLIHGIAFGLNRHVASVSLFELFAFAWLASDGRAKSIKLAKLVLNVALNARLGEYFCCLIECKYQGETKENGAGQIFPWKIDFKDMPNVKTSAEISSWRSQENVLFCPNLSDFSFAELLRELDLNIDRISLSVLAILYQLVMAKSWRNPQEIYPLYVKNKVAQTSIERKFDPPLNLRDLSIRDVALLKQIEEKAYDFGWSEGNFVDALNENYIAKALINNTALVGYFFWQQVLDECHLLNFTIASERQRRGLGNWMLSQLLLSLRTKSITAIYLEVRPSNDTAISLYSKFGFSIIGRRKNYYPGKESREDALVMKRAILT